MDEQHKMREQLRAHSLQVKQQSSVEPKRSQRLEEELELLKQEVDSMRIVKPPIINDGPQRRFPVSQTCRSPEAQGVRLSSVMEEQVSEYRFESAAEPTLVESPRGLSTASARTRKMGWATRSRAGLPIPIEGSIDLALSQDTSVLRLEEEPLPGLSTSRPILAEGGFEELGSATTFVFPEDGPSAFGGASARGETCPRAAPRRRRGRPKVINPFVRGEP
jgi:hypothetical protein